MITPADLAAAPLGHATAYPDRYDANLLFTVPRATERQAIGIAGALPFTGVDQWTAFELSWLDREGKPAVAIATLEVPATSPTIVESKSMKLYLGSFAQMRHAGQAEVARIIARDLSAATGATIRVDLIAPTRFAGQRIAELPGENIDTARVTIDHYDVDPALLRARGGSVTEVLRTDLFRSQCPLTGQPDYASVAIAYRGPRIDRAALLRYLVSYRRHPGFHEHCVERIFVEVMAACRCEALTVQARFTRRGGIDINPFRTSTGASPPAGVRTARQ